jgi:hypothetical protein
MQEHPDTLRMRPWCIHTPDAVNRVSTQAVLMVVLCSLGHARCRRYVVLSGYCCVYRDPQQASSNAAPAGGPSRRATLEQRRATLEQQQARGASLAGARQLSMRRGSSAADGTPDVVPLVGQGCVGVLNGTSSRRCTWDVLQVQMEQQQQLEQQVAGEGPGAGAGPLGSPSRRGTLERNVSIVGGTPRAANTLDINSECWQ